MKCESFCVRSGGALGGRLGRGLRGGGPGLELLAQGRRGDGQSRIAQKCTTSRTFHRSPPIFRCRACSPAVFLRGAAAAPASGVISSRLAAPFHRLGARRVGRGLPPPQPQPAPRQRRGDQRQCEEARAYDPSHPLACPCAHLVHDELLAAAHLAVGFQERREPRDAEVVEAARAAALAFLVVERVGGDAVAFGIGAGIGEDRLLGAAEIERAQRREGMFGGVDQRLVGARRHRKVHRGRGEDRGRGPSQHHDAAPNRIRASGMQQRGEEPGDRQRGAEGAHHGGAGRQVEDEGDGEPGGARERTGRSSRSRAAAPAPIRVEHADRGGDDQEREHQQHARRARPSSSPRRRRSHRTRTPRRTARRRRGGARSSQCTSADRGVERHDHRKLVRAAGEDVAGEDLLEVLGALRRAVDEEDRRRGRDDIDDADQRLLRHPSGPGARAGEERGGGERERRANSRRPQAPARGDRA